MSRPLETSDRPRVLVVDDDEGCRRAVRRALERAGLDVVEAAGVAAASAVLEGGGIACILTESRLPDGPAADLLARAAAGHPDTGRAVLTGAPDPEAAQDAVNRGALHAFYAKPWENATLAEGVRGVVDRARLAAENRRLLARLEDRNRELESLVVLRTQQVGAAKRELEALFDAWREPLAVVTRAFTVRRANRAWARAAGMEVRSVPGATCHAALFGRDAPCAECPVAAALAGGDVREARVAGRDGEGPLRVQASPLALPGEPAALCRYEMS